VILTLVTNSKLVGCISGRSAGFASKRGRLQTEIPGRLNLGLSGNSWGYKKPPSRRVIALAQDSFDRGKAR
jgi:hypothetical protein